jgi:predicted RNase H-like nuclease
MTVVLGVDGCRGGWVGALLVGDRVELVVGDTIADLVGVAPTEPVVVGIDIPIGLPDRGPRQADVAARRRLPVGRKSSVFPTPVRTAVSAATWQEANEANRRASGKGLSHQGFNLCRKIAEVDLWVRSGPGVPVLEVHPEVSFAAMGADTVPPKKTAEGRGTRLAALRGAGLALPDLSRTATYDVDDALDACAVAWTARRHHRGESRALPEVPERFSDGLPAAIHV